MVGKPDEGTPDLVRGIGSRKLRVVENEWCDERRRGGELVSELTNMALAECTGDWAFYLQADEVIHEQALPVLERAMEDKLGDAKTRAVGMRIRNFHGDYWTFNPYAHRKVVRMIRNDGSPASAGDAVSFYSLNQPDRRLIQYANPEAVHWLNRVHIFHYSWVKDRRSLLAKKNLMEEHYYGDAAQVFTDYELDYWYKRFRGSHPRVMSQRIAQFESPLPPYPNRWLNPRFYAYLFRHGYKG